jgi:hypothetical protein
VNFKILVENESSYSLKTLELLEGVISIQNNLIHIVLMIKSKHDLKNHACHNKMTMSSTRLNLC